MARLALCGLVALNLFSVECRCSVLFIGVESICQLGLINAQFLVLQEDIVRLSWCVDSNAKKSADSKPYRHAEHNYFAVA